MVLAPVIEAPPNDKVLVVGPVREPKPQRNQAFQFSINKSQSTLKLSALRQ